MFRNIYKIRKRNKIKRRK